MNFGSNEDGSQQTDIEDSSAVPEEVPQVLGRSRKAKDMSYGKKH